MSDSDVDRTGSTAQQACARLDTAGWGVFLMWVGVALFTDIGWPVFFLGTGLIMLGGQAARRRCGAAPDRFALVLGACFVVFGALRAFDVPLGALVAPGWLVPAVFVAAGAAVVVSAWRRRGPRA